MVTDIFPGSDALCHKGFEDIGHEHSLHTTVANPSNTVAKIVVEAITRKSFLRH